MSSIHRIGAWGEAVACALLEACGYAVLARRYRVPGGEIDLVVRRGGVVAFVEVKTRGPSSLAPPEDWVDGRKLARLRRAARRWLDENPEFAAAEYRIDVVAVRHGGRHEGAEIRHLVGVG